MKYDNNTCEQLLIHYKNYPKLQIRDIFKFLYQSSFGCEHLVLSEKNVNEYIRKEYEEHSGINIGAIEHLDGDYCRVPISYLNSGLAVDTFGKLFALSAKKEANGKSELIKKLDAVRSLICEDVFHFSVEEFDNAVKAWEADGFKAVRHSEIFREEYHPSYRVIAKKFIPFLPLFAKLDKLLDGKSVKIAIEGGSACGKTTLSKMMSEIYDCSVFHMDDFFLRPEQRTPERYAEPGGNVDRERFLDEVLLPLNEGKVVKYRKFSCSEMKLGEVLEEQPKKLILVEGAYSMHPYLADYYDFSVFLDVSPKLQKERIIHRNSPEFAKNFFERWIPLETEYFKKMNVKERCGMIIEIS